MFTYKKTPYKIFVLDPKFYWAGPDHNMSPCDIYIYRHTPIWLDIQ